MRNHGLYRGEELKLATIASMRGVLEHSRLEFISENGGDAGVRLKKGSSTDGTR
jgi:hypothetical protein